MFKNLQMQNKELQDETKDDSEQMPIVIPSSPNAAKPNVMRRYVIMGVEFDNLWKPIELFVGENEFDILLTTDDFKDAAKYVDLESAEYVIEYLNNNYSDYSWHVVVSINGA